MDKTNTIRYTTFKEDLGLSFSACCQKFSSLLDERRTSGDFYADGIDVSVNTGELKKFSYMGTPDGKYLFELGVNISELEAFRKFNFVATGNYLAKKYDELLEVRILNMGGYFLIDSSEEYDELSVDEMPIQFQQAFKKAKASLEPVEYSIEHMDGTLQTYRFVPYEAEVQRGDSTTRVIYMKYTNKGELILLQQNTKQYFRVLGISLLVSLIVLTVMIRILSSTFNLAKYDPLTGVLNRASYLARVKDALKSKNKTIGLLLIDLDNFKMVNDQFGHAAGDEVLIKASEIFEHAVKRKKGFAARLGGDEFAVVVPYARKDKLEAITAEIMASIKEVQNESHDKEVWNVMSVSIGGALSANADNENKLFKRADEALYQSKKAGKSQYYINA